MRRSALLVFALAGCAAKSVPMVAVPVVQPIVEVRTVEKKAAPCVKREQVPDEPPVIAGKLTGAATYDVGPLAQSARELREALRTARELLLKCVG